MIRFTFALVSANLRGTFAQKLQAVCLLVVFSLVAFPLRAAVFVVTSTANSGAGTLRQAITDANASVDASSEIRFQNGLGEIVINASLPAMIKPIKINGYYNSPASMGAISDRTGLPVKIRLDDPATYLFTLGTGSSGSEICGIDFHIIGGGNTAVCIYKSSTATVNDVHIWGNSFNYDYSTDAPYPGSRGIFTAIYGVVSSTLTSNGSGWYIGAKTPGFEYREGNLIANNLSSVNVATVQLRDLTNFVIAGNYFGFQRNGITPLYSSIQSDHLSATNCNNLLIGVNSNMYISSKRNLFACGNGVRLLYNSPSGTHTLPGTTSYYWDGNNSVKGNYFGADKNGVPLTATSTLHITLQGSTNNIIGGPNAWERNIITGATSAGIRVYNSSVNPGSTITYTAATNNTIQNNYIGVGSDGTTAGPNAMGINLSATNTGTSTSDLIINNSITGNRIAYNTGAGINIQKSISNGFVRYNTITQNAIYQNGGLGIALTGDGLATQAGGVDGNDGALSADAAAVQQHMDNPVINSIIINSATSATISGYIGNVPAGSTTFAGATVEMFVADITPSADNGAVHYGDGQSRAHGEGAVYLGATTADAIGLFTATVTGTGFTTNTLFTGTATLSGSTSEFGPSISNQIILPVTLLTFTLSPAQDGILLQWTTATEQNNKGFEVERSIDGNDWKRIGFVTSQAFNGNSMVKLIYRYTDQQPAVGTNYYRIKQVDFDGRFEYSPIRLLQFKGGNVAIYPNPAKDNITVQGLTGGETIRIYDATRRKVKQLKSRAAQQVIGIADLSEGTYFIIILAADGSISVHRITKAR
ncbi:MAG: T9SS type A sorting domain-containing protein [Agriterribacter sp.]